MKGCLENCTVYCVLCTVSRCSEEVAQGHEVEYDSVVLYCVLCTVYCVLCTVYYVEV